MWGAGTQGHDKDLDLVDYWYELASICVDGTPGPVFFNILFETSKWIWYTDREKARYYISFALHSNILNSQERDAAAQQWNRFCSPTVELLEAHPRPTAPKKIGWAAPR